MVSVCGSVMAGVAFVMRLVFLVLRGNVLRRVIISVKNKLEFLGEVCRIN